MMSEEQYHSASLCKYLQSVRIHNQSTRSDARPYTYICRLATDSYPLRHSKNIGKYQCNEMFKAYPQLKQFYSRCEVL